MIRNAPLAVGALLSALLSGCVTAPPAPQSARPVAPYRQDVELAGRLSVSYQQDGQPASLTGRFSWRQSARRTDISLISPLGQTVAQIGVTPQRATLTQSDGAVREAPDIDTLSARALGWPLPVSGLRDWLQGYAVDGAGARFAASPSHDRVTTRDGWRLHFVSWQDADAESQAAVPGAPRAGAPRAAAPRPKRIDAERSGDFQTVEVAIRIVLDPPPSP